MSAQILPFTSTPRSKSLSRKGAPADTTPTIVILPCVRYERWSEDEPQAAEARLAMPAHH